MNCEFIDVCAAVVIKDSRLLLATRKPGGHLAGKWEFPGGKIGTGESPADCIVRELQEELQYTVSSPDELFSLDFQYPEKNVRLRFMLCQPGENQTPAPQENQHCGWFTPEEAAALDLAPADMKVIELLRSASQNSIPEDFHNAAPEKLKPVLDFMNSGKIATPQRMPEWLHVPFEGAKARLNMKGLIREGGLHTVCESANCPNRCDCWKRKTATFMILGGTCTRFCRFCAVNHGKPEPPDPAEAEKVAESVESLGLSYAVITCVTRDDLPDGGAAAMAAAVTAIRNRTPDTRVEVLCSDYNGDKDCIETVLKSGPAVFGHNLETVERLTPAIRNRANYRRSLDVLAYAAAKSQEYGSVVKSGIMLGLGETDEEIRRTLADLKQAGTEIVTLGQYLRPSRKHWPVSRLVTPAEFRRWSRIAEDEYGFSKAVAGPLVRSSYMAEEAWKTKSAKD